MSEVVITALNIKFLLGCCSYLIVEVGGSSLERSTTHSDDLPPLGTLELLDENNEGEHSTGDSIEGGASANCVRPTGVVANICNKSFKHICKARYDDSMGYKRKSMKKPAYFMDVQWMTYTDAWKLPENIKVCERCSTNRRQGREKAFGTHCNGCITFEETVEKMTEENNWILPTFVDVFGKTYTFRTIDSHGMVSQNATQFNVSFILI
ncbi:hypothetical protein SASPL_137458 [Salvia splendens]|uniref:Uncharacterized protein n=1 Tax=Salvia splendens TaxID=180675 RepID=A0A8X8ZCY7_SALSN|nr:hypothetical protein SASPL_137458 [Salvia splendens]